jgi:succinylglutamate desuccinylase
MNARPGRIIGTYQGRKKGPLLLVFGGMHGNEPSGVQALELVFKMLEVEPITNPAFEFKGRMVGICGNVRALRKGTRYIRKDLNRQWTPENVERVLKADSGRLSAEDLEMREISLLVQQEINWYQPEQMIVLDLHSTTAFGGIFSIATDDPESLRIAMGLHAPVIRGMLKGITGSSLHYFCSDNFEPHTVTVAFEGGQHDEPLSVNRCIAAIINCLRTIGAVRPDDVENRHDSILIEYAKGLPKVAQLLYVHDIAPRDRFEMLPGFKNFQPIEAGTELARDRRGSIYAPIDGLILMPLYQLQGTNGFFIVEAESQGELHD